LASRSGAGTVEAMTLASNALGAYGERVATRALVEAGLGILSRNWRGRSGELDIVARDGTTIVFCEVKTRRSTAFGAPVEAVDPVKVRRLRALAAQWLRAHPDERGEVRFDVVSVVAAARGAARIEHLRAAF
jgi:putative endonuclease